MSHVAVITDAPVAVAAAPAAPAAPVPPGFAALLERLQRFTPSAVAPAVTTTDELHEAVRAADASFTTAMDLRRQLEEAFRRHAGPA